LKYLTNQDMISLYHQLSESLGISPGTQGNFNHLGCPAGEDTKKRLYGRITEDGTKLLAYCHHCGCKGVKAFSRLYRPALSQSAIDLVYSGIGESTPLGDTSPDNKRWEFWSRVWERATPYTDKLPDDFLTTFPGRFFQDQKDFTKLEFRNFYDMRLYSVGSEIVLIPRFGEQGLLGIDSRQTSLSPDKDRPKWRRVLATTSDGKEIAGKLVIYNYSGSKIGVVVEDPISAMRVDIAGYAGIALTCSVMSSEDAFKLSLLFDQIIIWLDNDSPAVIAHATASASKLMMYGVEVNIVNGMDDPKRHTTEEIAQTVIHSLNDNA